MSFPRPSLSLHQIELSTRCSLRCVYCPSPAIVDGKYPGRSALDMTMAHFLRALEWVKLFVRQGTQKELNLAGIGESTLHPAFAEMVLLARRAVGPTVTLTFATNGIGVDEEMVKKIAPAKPEVWVSLHRPEKAARAVQLYKQYGLFVGHSTDPAMNANDWAGQVNWMNSGNRFPCPWLRWGWIMAMADGRLTTCCLDASGSGVVGHVDDPLGSVVLKPYELCKKCYQTIDSPEWDQERGIPISSR